MRHTAFWLSPALAWSISFTLQAAPPDVADLMKALQGGSDQEQIEAGDSLGDIGANAAEAVPQLIAGLSDENCDVRWHSARALGAIGSKAEKAVPALIKALADEDASVRSYAAFALGRIGKAAMPAVDRLVTAAFDSDPQVRRVSLQALRAIDPPPETAFPVWLKALESSEPGVASAAIQAIAEQGKEVVPKIRQLLKHPKAAYWACLIAAQLGPDAAEVVPDIEETLKHADPDVRLEALLALGEIGKAASSAAPTVLHELAKDEFPHVRVAAAYAVAKIGVASPEAKDTLLEARKGNDPLLRLVATWALVQLQPDSKEYAQEAVDLATEAMASEDTSLKTAAARVLTELPDVDRPIVVDHLVKALQSGDPYLVGNLIDALAGMGPQVVPKITPSLENPSLRMYTLRVFARLGPDAAAAVPALVKAIEKPANDPADIEFQREAQMVLARIGPKAKAAVPALIRSLDSNDEHIRGSATFALGRIGPEAREAMPKLGEMVRSDPNDRLKRLAIWTALRITPGNPRLEKIAMPVLIRALQNQKDLVRAEAATTLGELGMVAKSAVAELEKLKNDPSPLVRTAVEEALKKIEKASEGGDNPSP